MPYAVCTCWALTWRDERTLSFQTQVCLCDCPLSISVLWQAGHPGLQQTAKGVVTVCPGEPLGGGHSNGCYYCLSRGIKMSVWERKASHSPTEKTEDALLCLEICQELPLNCFRGFCGVPAGWSQHPD